MSYDYKDDQILPFDMAVKFLGSSRILAWAIREGKIENKVPRRPDAKKGSRMYNFGDLKRIREEWDSLQVKPKTTQELDTTGASAIAEVIDQQNVALKAMHQVIELQGKALSDLQKSVHLLWQEWHGMNSSDKQEAIDDNNNSKAFETLSS